MRKHEIHCNVRVEGPWRLFGELEAARLAGPGSDVRTAEGIILSVVVGADESSQKAMLAAYHHNSSIYAEHPELLARYHQRPRGRSQHKSRGTSFSWLDHMGGDPYKRRAATLARERAEREQEVAA